MGEVDVGVEVDGKTSGLWNAAPAAASTVDAVPFVPSPVRECGCRVVAWDGEWGW